MPKVRRSPQDKKRLSYAKDRRNAYGENDKSSRKNIAKNKRAPHRSNRRWETVVLEAAEGQVDAGVEEAVESRLLSRRPKTWRKWRDEPLWNHVQDNLARRAKLENAGEGFLS
ncbi:hypothetical protein OIE66_38045 [Nonomuraea sp. NBC_01738]|uniref:hypothetical protein n=1 Tax=Nonomuraea sp. NBC_01738 TaxID=2976003 RepID=UPI002E120259|nr:hypothetical protein OIE66_38045 [Nonomuraea sp. NBC_01738]